jgi:cytochrome c-type biogenesis protein CcmE
MAACCVGLAGLLAALFLLGMKDNAIYSKPVDELVAQRSHFTGRPVRVDGTLVHGTLLRREQPCEYRFTIAKNGVELPVRYAHCTVPDTFRDVPNIDVGVTAQGEIKSDGSFEASDVLAKCPSKYEMQQQAGRGERMPHAAADDGTSMR